MSAPLPTVEVDSLRIVSGTARVEIVQGVSFAILPGEVLGLVGESGSGKTSVALALLGHARRGMAIAGGSVAIGDLDVLKLTTPELERVRGRLISYVPQDPDAALNPALRIGVQVNEMLDAHGCNERAERPNARLAEMMREVALPDVPQFLKRYPHELSGGQKQRVVLAMAFACRPPVIVLDEPTTGLDVITQAHVLATIRDLTARYRAAALYVSHDIAVVGTLASRMAVLYAGSVVELGPTTQLLRSPAHPYTRRLLAATPRLTGEQRLVGISGRPPPPGQRPPGCSFAPRCQFVEQRCTEIIPELREAVAGHYVRCVRADDLLRARSTLNNPGARVEGARLDTPALALKMVSAGYQGRTVVHNIAFDLASRECLALVGESGSGKTTIARCIAGLHRYDTGRISLDGATLASSARERTREQRRTIQYVFQNPYGSLNPRRKVGEIIRRPLELFTNAKGADNDRTVAEMLDRVMLPPSYVHRFPSELSGGERQRVAIARALACHPTVLVCDEITSSLDVSVQAALIDLLIDMQRASGLAMLFVTHHLALVRSVAHRIAVLKEGRLVELGAVDQVIEAPADPYTSRLLSCTPSLESVFDVEPTQSNSPLP